VIRQWHAWACQVAAGLTAHLGTHGKAPDLFVVRIRKSLFVSHFGNLTRAQHATVPWEATVVAQLHCVAVQWLFHMARGETWITKEIMIAKKVS
jgi:hypothetical protein